MSANPALFINFSTKAARDLVRKALAPHPQIGLRAPDIYKNIHEQFPDAKEDPKYVPQIFPEQVNALKAQTRYPDHPEHPVRSMKHLKRSILEEMVNSGEVQEVILRKNPSQSSHTNVTYKFPRPQGRVHETLPERLLPLGVAMEWRWRLIPGAEPNYPPEPDWEERRKKREQENKISMARERAKHLRKAEAKKAHSLARERKMMEKRMKRLGGGEGW